MKLVDVVVPCHNVQSCLPRALSSAQHQTFRDFTIYVVDDASTDCTRELLRNFPECHVLSLPHRSGAATARNYAIRNSSAPFIAFLDADDEWLPFKLERQLALLEANPDVGLVCCACHPGELPLNDTLSGSSPPMPLLGRLFSCLVRNCFVFTPTVVVRRECLKDSGLFNESLSVSEDFNLWLRIAARWKIAFLPEVLAVRHRSPESLSFSTDPGVIQQQGIAALEHVEQSCPGLSFENRRALRLALAERNYCYGSYLLSTGAANAARQKFATALQLDPSHWRALAKRSFSFLPASAFRSFTQLKIKRNTDRKSTPFHSRSASQ